MSPKNTPLRALLAAYQGQFHPLVALSSQDSWLWLDLSTQNADLSSFDLENVEEMSRYIFGLLQAKGAKLGLGGYAEDRMVYQKSEIFADAEGARSIHLGIDLWMPAQTPIYAPWEAKVHSYQDNLGRGNYGPTILLEHELEGTKFFTLYGHLSQSSLEGLHLGKTIPKGQLFAYFGNSEENGNWAPHLHFQIIKDLEGNWGDFIGVASKSKKEHYLALCPDPNLILNFT